jgi:hypothetical protein
VVIVNMALWIIAGVLAFAFAGSGIMKLVQSKDKLVASPTGGWAPTLTNVTVPPCYGRCHRVRRFITADVNLAEVRTASTPPARSDGLAQNIANNSQRR